MWTLIVVTMFYQRSYQPEISYQGFENKDTCVIAANATAEMLREVISESSANNVFFRTQCLRNQ